MDANRQVLTTTHPLDILTTPLLIYCMSQPYTVDCVLTHAIHLSLTCTPHKYSSRLPIPPIHSQEP